MISKEEFCKIMDKLTEYDQECDAVNIAMERLYGSYSFIGYDIPHTDIIFDLLKDMFNLDKDDNIIADWLYDAIFDSEVECNGVKYKLHTAGDLYDYLIDTCGIAAHKE